MTEDTDTDTTEVDRRQVLASAAGIASAGAAGYLLGTGNAAAAPSGEVGTSADPLLHAFADSMVLTERTSDVSSPSNGEMWYNSTA